MAQSTDITLANQSGLAFRTELNSILAALSSLQSGSSDPSTTNAYQLWVDTSTTPGKLKIRNGANSAWIVVSDDITAVNLGLVSDSGATFTGNVTMNAQSDVRFADADSSNFVALQGAATISSNLTFTLPTSYGSSGQFLETAGDGTVSFSSLPVGSTSQQGILQLTNSTSSTSTTTAATPDSVRSAYSLASSALPKSGGQMTGNITFSGSQTVDGRDVATDGTKLDGIEAGATADQTAAEIRTLVESATDSNVFTDADHTKLDGIEAGADVTDATNVDAAGAVMNSDSSSAAMQFVVDEDNMSSNSATKVPTQQSVKAYVDAEVAGVVDSAPGALDTLNELAAALGDDANFSTTVTNSIATKLPLAGGTMTGNITMSGSQTVDGRDLSVDGSKLDGIATGATAYANSDVDAHLNRSTASSGELLSWNGSDYDWVAGASGGASAINDLSDAKTQQSGQTIGIGTGALAVNSGDNYNLAVGYQALNDNTNGQFNVAIGMTALSLNVSGLQNTAVGYQALYSSTTASSNTSVGKGAMSVTTTGGDNSSVGMNSLGALTTGTGNCGIGKNAGSNLTTGSNNIAIGNGAAASSATVSNEITLGDSSVTSLRIPGLQSGASNGQVLTYNSSNGNITLASAAGLSNNASGSSSFGLGTSALDSETTGFSNTAFGESALTAATSGYRNTAIGYSAAGSITTGAGNVAIGRLALSNSTSGFFNVAIGQAMTSTTSAGSDNIGIGDDALKNVTGSSNAGIGKSSGRDITSGTSNSCYGKSAGQSITTGTTNTAIGEQAGDNTTTGSNNTSIGYQAEPSSATVSNEVTLGNSSVTSLRIPGLQSGASNGQVLTYNSSNGNITLADAGGGGGVSDNSAHASSIGLGSNALDSETSGTSNTALGKDALTALTVGSSNIGIGVEAGKSITSGTNNTAVGFEALPYVTTGDYNTGVGSQTLGRGGSSGDFRRATALGYRALYTNDANDNTAVGYIALEDNTTGTSNTAVGKEALKQNTSGAGNTGVGHDALTACTTGNNNTSVGEYSLLALTTGYQNVALGYDCMRAETNGHSNVAVGSNAAKLANGGSSNTSVGHQAAENLTSGSNNTSLGYDAKPSSATSSNEVTLGNAFVSSLRCNTTSISSLSDGRDKTEVKDLPLGLDFIDTLRPVKFKWETRDGNCKDGSYEAGFIAQDLQSAQSTSNAEYLKMVIDENPDRLEAAYGQLVPVLVKAVQELSAENVALKARLDAAGI